MRISDWSSDVCSSDLIAIAPPLILSDLPRLKQAMAADAPPLMLVSRRHLRSLNSWMHNVDTLVTGRDRCTLQMHSADATRHGLAVGDTVALSSTAGEIHVPLEIDDDIRPGVVSMPHGWGPSDPHSRLTVRSEAHTSELQSLMR